MRQVSFEPPSTKTKIDTGSRLRHYMLYMLSSVTIIEAKKSYTLRILNSENTTRKQRHAAGSHRINYLNAVPQ